MTKYMTNIFSSLKRCYLNQCREISNQTTIKPFTTPVLRGFLALATSNDIT